MNRYMRLNRDGLAIFGSVVSDNNLGFNGGWLSREQSCDRSDVKDMRILLESEFDKSHIELLCEHDIAVSDLGGVSNKGIWKFIGENIERTVIDGLIVGEKVE